MKARLQKISVFFSAGALGGCIETLVVWIAGGSRAPARRRRRHGARSVAIMDLLDRRLGWIVGRAVSHSASTSALSTARCPAEPRSHGLSTVRGVPIVLESGTARGPPVNAHAGAGPGIQRRMGYDGVGLAPARSRPLARSGRSVGVCGSVVVDLDVALDRQGVVARPLDE